MFRFLCKTVLYSRNGYRNVTPHYNPSSMVASSSLIRYFSSDADSDNPHSFTLSYLTQTCGLSPKSALSASKRVRFASSDKPDSVVSCFQKFGFSKSQISEIIGKFPNVLCCKPEKTISTKVEFFRSKGVSLPEIITIFTLNPWILRSSLENQLVGAFNMLVELFQSDDKVIRAIKRNPYILCRSLQGGLTLNINILRENGVPSSNIFLLICNHSLCIRTNPVKFKKTVEEVKEMGFDPLNSHFVIAIAVLTVSTKAKKDGRVEVYKRWGWSDEDITTAFKKFPWCMSVSEDKIMAVMSFYINKMGLDSSFIVNRPELLSYSLNKRLIPRGAVIQEMSSKGLVELDSKTSHMFKCSERDFLEKYVKCHGEAPHLIKLYNDKLNEAISEGKRKS